MRSVSRYTRSSGEGIGQDQQNTQVVEIFPLASYLSAGFWAVELAVPTSPASDVPRWRMLGLGSVHEDTYQQALEWCNITTTYVRYYR